MGVVLKESLLNEGFTHYQGIEKTVLVLYVCSSGGGAEYFINILQRDSDGDTGCVTIAEDIMEVHEAHKVFEDFDKALALEGFGLSHTKGQNSSEQIPVGQDPGSTPEDVEKRRKEDLVRDLVEGLDDSLD